jgi:hypothetical protein
MSAVISDSTAPETRVFRAPDIQLLRAELGTVRGLRVISENRVLHLQAQVHDQNKPPLQQWFELIPEIQAQARESIKRQMEEWFGWMDGILDVHRSNFVFRDPMPEQLAEHKTGLEFAIEYGRLIHTLLDDPGFHEPDLVSRLKVRMRQLQDAYETFHDATLSEAQAEDVLKQVFLE